MPAWNFRNLIGSTPKAILADGVAIGNAQARAIVWYPRIDMNMAGAQIYPDTGSAWNMAYMGRNINFNGTDEATMTPMRGLCSTTPTPQ